MRERKDSKMTSKFLSEREANGTVGNDKNNGHWSEGEAEFGKERYMEWSFEHTKFEVLLDLQMDVGSG